MTEQKKWHQVVISDVAEVSGNSILELLKCIMEVEQFKFVILNNIEIFGEDWLMYILNQNNIMRVKDFMFILPDAERFEWGDIFLFKEFPKSWDDSGNISDLINQTDTTISADDYFYMVVYTPHDSVIDNINKRNYEIKEFKNKFLKNLGYPCLTLLK